MIRTAFVLAALAAAGTAQGAFFSFASDTADQNWSFTGSGNKVYDGGGVNDAVPVTLLIDDDNGPLSEVSFAGAAFIADFTLSNGSRTQRTASAYNYSYDVAGFFEFRDARGTLLLRCEFNGAQMIIEGSVTSWGPKGTIFGSDFTEAIVTYSSELNLPAYGVVPGTFVGASDFGFDITALNRTGTIPFNPADRGVEVSAANGFLPTEWFSEGSYSGSAVPSSGSVALLGLAATAAFRRKR